ncbi:hypothetical protein SLNHY_1540 [Streptomyces albus]|nr:hypothetical protein SLNHY_1540 [Streptomyces albus]
MPCAVRVPPGGGAEHPSVRGMIYIVAKRDSAQATGPYSSVGRASPW